MISPTIEQIKWPPITALRRAAGLSGIVASTTSDAVNGMSVSAIPPDAASAAMTPTQPPARSERNAWARNPLPDTTNMTAPGWLMGRTRPRLF